MLMFGEVGSDKKGELVWGVFFNDVELVEVDVGEDIELVLLDSLAFEFNLRGGDS
jgi:hypothetical protein